MAKAKGDDPSGTNQQGAPAAGASFEESIEQIEAIIDRIERGEQGLERSITDYERGAGLLKVCREILARSEQRIQEIEADLSAAAPPPPGGTGSRATPKKPGSTPPPARTDDGDTPF